MKQIFEEILRSLNVQDLKSQKITVGFDGCCDSVFRVVKNRHSNGSEYFKTMSEFGEYISQKGGVSCSIELEEITRKVGGNCAIFAGAVSALGIETSAVGLFGTDNIHSAFADLAGACKLYSYGENANAIAMEFNDGKVMLSPSVKLKTDAWDSILSSVGVKKMNQIFLQTNMLALLNWSELEFSTHIWSKLYEYISVYPSSDQQIIIDLADCSRNSKDDICEMLTLIELFNEKRKVILSLNENEALQLAKHFDLPQKDYREVGQALARHIKAQTIVIHTARACYTFEYEKVFEAPGQYNSRPKLLTGAGDNFNAGYAIGRMLCLDADCCNILGNSVTSYYVTHGVSPNIFELIDHIKMWRDSLDFK